MLKRVKSFFKILTFILLIVTTGTLHSQMSKSEELGKYNGIPAIDITKNYPKDKKGLSPRTIPFYMNMTSDFKITHLFNQDISSRSLRVFSWLELAYSFIWFHLVGNVVFQ